MPGTNEIKQRIDSVKSTQKITNAMYLISSTKLQKAKQKLDDAKPYMRALETEIRRILDNAEEDDIYFHPDNYNTGMEKVPVILVITADKGLAGSYNNNVIKATETELKRKPNARLYVVGDYGRRYFTQRKVPFVDTFVYTSQDPTFHRSRRISAELLQLFNEGTINDIQVIYSRLQGIGDAEVERVRLLPLARPSSAEIRKAAEKKKTDEYNPFEFLDYLNDSGEHGGYKKDKLPFYPSVHAVLDSIMQSYLSSYIFGALLESYCSEQNARMNAMNSANENAEELKHELTVRFNRVRQADITQEITEVSAGSKAQRKKREKEGR